MDDASKIEAQNVKFVELYNRGEIDRLVELFSENAMVMLAKAEIIEGRKHIQGAFKFMKRHICSIKNSTSELSVYGSVAVEVGLYEHFDEETNTVDVGKFLVVWRKINDVWLIDKDSLSTSRR